MSEPRLRNTIAHSAAASLETLPRAAQQPRALVGFDGFIDSIIDVVDTRRDLSAEGYQRLRTITAFADRAAAAAGRSTNMELVTREERFGGNGPLLAGALARLTMPTTYIGAVGDEAGAAAGIAAGGVHPVFAEFASRCERVLPLCPPARTDALEFDDGKIMFNKPANMRGVDWQLLTSRIALPDFVTVCAASSLIAMVNWVMTGGAESIWNAMIREVLPNLPPDPARRVFIDLSDPAKRTDEDVARALKLIGEMQRFVPVTLGLNLAESERIATICGVRANGSGLEGRETSSADCIRETCIALRERLGLDTVVIHPRHGAAAATRAGESVWFDGPFTNSPRLSTGAGDHFNAGFGFAQVHGLPQDESLAVGCAVSGAYVRDAASPTLARLIEFLRNLPVAEAARL